MQRNSEPFRNEEWLIDQYVYQRQTMGQMARLAGCRATTISNWLAEFGIPSRGRGHAQIQHSEAPHHSRAWLVEHYVTKGLTVARLAELAGCSPMSIHNWLVKLDVPIRKRGTVTGGYRAGIGFRTAEWLTEHYVNQGLTLEACARAAGCGPQAISYWLDKLGIPLRSRSENQSTWTQAELEFIKAHRTELTVPEIAKHLGRSHSALKRLFHRNPDLQFKRAKDRRRALRRKARAVPAESGVRVCLRCERLLPVSRFHKNAGCSDGLDTQCKQCACDRVMLWNRANPERVARNIRNAYIRRTYGMEPEEYEALLDRQDGACAICRKPATPSEWLKVDHDHATGAIRGLLCNSCNLGLGRFGDAADGLQMAIAYLKRTEAAPLKA